MRRRRLPSTWPGRRGVGAVSAGRPRGALHGDPIRAGLPTVPRSECRDERRGAACVDDGGLAEPGRTSTIVATVKGGTSVGTSSAFDGAGLCLRRKLVDARRPVTVTTTYPASVSILGVTLFSGNLTTRRTSRGPQLKIRIHAIRQGEQGQTRFLRSDARFASGCRESRGRRRQRALAAPQSTGGRGCRSLGSRQGSPRRYIRGRRRSALLRDRPEHCGRIIVDAVVVTGAGTSSCDGWFGPATLAPESVCVVVHTNTPGFFSRILGLDMLRPAHAQSQRSRKSSESGRGSHSAFAPEPLATTRRCNSRLRQAINLTMLVVRSTPRGTGLLILRRQPDRGCDQVRRLWRRGRLSDPDRANHPDPDRSQHREYHQQGL